MWPSMVLPKVLLAQLLQVRFKFAGNARPSAVEPLLQRRVRELIAAPVALEPARTSTAAIGPNAEAPATGAEVYYRRRSCHGNDVL
jgi:hypothetical protein